MHIKFKELWQINKKMLKENDTFDWIKANVINKDCFLLEPKKLGSKYRDKTIYLIQQNCHNLGFFAVYRRVMEAVYFAEVCGYTPVIELSDNFLYKEKYPVNGHENPYEYYFCQPSDLSVAKARKGISVISQQPLHNYMIELVLTGKYGVYDFTNQYIDIMADTVNKYMKLNEETQAYIEEGIKKLFQGKRTIGVHVRGSDYKRNYNIHPVRILEEEYIDLLLQLLKEGDWEQIFLATDDEKSLRKMQEAFGTKLVYYHDVKRSDSQKSVAFSNDKRDKHKYKLGLEVLRDVYTLSSCCGLVAGISQVSICTQIIKKSKKEEFELINILNNGINHNSRGFQAREK